jgi:hypothetical protein
MTLIAWIATEMSTLEANQIFAVIQQGIPAQRLNLTLKLDNHSDGVVRERSEFVYTTILSLEECLFSVYNLVVPSTNGGNLTTLVADCEFNCTCCTSCQ